MKRRWKLIDIGDRILIVATLVTCLFVAARVYSFTYNPYPSICRPSQQVTTKFKNERGGVTVVLDCKEKQ